MSMQVLDCLQLKIIHVSKWHVLGRSVLNLLIKQHYSKKQSATNLFLNEAYNLE